MGMAKRVLRTAGRNEEVAGVERRKAREAVLAAEAIVIRQGECVR